MSSASHNALDGGAFNGDFIDAPERLTPRALQRRRRSDSLYTVALASVIAVGTLVRWWQLNAKPGWQVDEVTYTSLAHNLLVHGTLNLPIAYSQPWTPFLFHPPFYFLLLAGWFKITGSGIYQARLLSVLMSAVASGLLARLLWRLHGPRAALVALTFVVFDGWLLYIQRASYIENTDMVLIIAMFLLYHRALSRPRTWLFFLVGVLAGAAVIFKHTGVYVVPAIIIHWLMSRREHRGHAIILGTAGAVIAGYIMMMIQLFDFNGHDWYVQQSLVQVERPLGLLPSKGTLTSPLAFIHLATHEYAVFLPSLIAALAGIAFLAADMLRCLRARSWAPLGGDTLIPAWALAGVIVFGLSALRYAEYFSLVLVPVYCYLWTRLLAVGRVLRMPRLALGAGAVVVLVASLVSFDLRVLSHDDNVFAQIKLYAETEIPRRAIVVAESSIAYEIPQRWCSPYGRQLTIACQQDARYLITWQTFLQSANPFHSAALANMLKRAVPVRKFSGFNGTVIVWRVN